MYTTKTIKKNLNPSWDEGAKIHFSLTKDIMKDPTVKFAIFDYGKLRELSLGVREE